MENLVKIAEDVLTSCLAVKTGEEVLIITAVRRLVKLFMKQLEILAAKNCLW